MKLREYYRSAEDLQRKIQRGIVKVDGKWSYISAVGQDIMYVHPLPTNGRANQTSVSTDEPRDKFDFNKVPLGMVNAKGGVVHYLCRAPKKQWTQAPTSANTYCWNIADPPGYREPRQQITGLMDNGLLETLNGDYPSIKDAWSMASTQQFPEKFLGRAFNREFAFQRSSVGCTKLMYKTTEVAEILIPKDRSLGEITLYPSYAYLKERLNNLGLQVA